MNKQGSTLVQEELEPELRWRTFLPQRMPSDAELHFRDKLSLGMLADSSSGGLDQLEKMPLSILCVLSGFSHVQLFGTLWTVAHQAPLSLGFSRQERHGIPKSQRNLEGNKTCPFFRLNQKLTLKFLLDFFFKFLSSSVSLSLCQNCADCSCGNLCICGTH